MAGGALHATLSLADVLARHRFECDLFFERAVRLAPHLAWLGAQILASLQLGRRAHLPHHLTPVVGGTQGPRVAVRCEIVSRLLLLVLERRGAQPFKLRLVPLVGFELGFFGAAVRGLLAKAHHVVLFAGDFHALEGRREVVAQLGTLVLFEKLPGEAVVGDRGLELVDAVGLVQSLVRD